MTKIKVTVSGRTRPEVKEILLRRKKPAAELPVVGVVYDGHSGAHIKIIHGINEDAINDYCTFRLLHVRERTMEAVCEVIPPELFKEIDCFLVIGMKFTLLMQEFCKKRGTRDILYLGVRDAEKAGIINSSKNPGGTTSGVCMEREPEDAMAKRIVLFSRLIKKALVVHHTQCSFGRLEKQAAEIKNILEGVGAEVCIERFEPGHAIESALKERLMSFETIVFLEGCRLNTHARALAQESWYSEKLFIGGQGMVSIDQGAPISHGPDYLALVPPALAMLREWCRKKRSLGSFPVVILPSKRLLYVNVPLLRHLGNVEELLEELDNRDDVVLIRHWPRSF